MFQFFSIIGILSLFRLPFCFKSIFLMFGLHLFRKSKNMFNYSFVLSCRFKQIFEAYKIYSLRESLIKEFIFNESLRGQLLIFRCLIWDVIFYRQFFNIWRVFAVILLSEISKYKTLEQKDVNNPIFETKQSSSNLLSLMIIYNYVFVWV